MKFGIYPNLGKADLKQALLALTGLLKKKQIDYSFPLSMKKGLMEMGFTEECYETEEIMGKRDFILSVGGDGSFLGAARTFADYPVLMAGLHLGDLGFFGHGKTDGTDPCRQFQERTAPLPCLEDCP
jgi:NAD+ kinase